MRGVFAIILSLIVSFPLFGQNYELLFVENDSLFYRYSLGSEQLDSITDSLVINEYEIEDSVLSIRGNVCVLKGDSIKVLVKHYATNETYNSKFQVGYLEPCLSNKKNTVVCHDTYYNDLRRRQVRKAVKDAYVVEIDINTKEAFLITMLPNAEIVRNLTLSPNDSLLYFFAVYDNRRSVGHYIYNFSDNSMQCLPAHSQARFIKWLR